MRGKKIVLEEDGLERLQTKNLGGEIVITRILRRNSDSPMVRVKKYNCRFYQEICLEYACRRNWHNFSCCSCLHKNEDENEKEICFIKHQRPSKRAQWSALYSFS